MAKRKKHSSHKRSSPQHVLQVKQPFITRKRLKYLSVILGFVFVIFIGGYSLLKIMGYFGLGDADDYLKGKLLFPPPKKVEKVEITYSDFAGSRACANCHSHEYKLQQNSTHGKAGGNPQDVNIIAKFDGVPLIFKDAVVVPQINDQGQYLFTVKLDGQPEFQFKVSGVVGGGHMIGGGTQTFFAWAPNGYLNFLPFDFIRKENLWFVQLKKNGHWTPVSKDISITELLQWPPHRFLGTVEGTSNCQNCHGSQILTTYNETENRFITKYQTLQINCESCHGPGKRHIRLVTSENYFELEDIGMEPLAALSKDQSLLVCFQCHAVKDVIKENYLSGMPLEDYFSLKLPLLGNSLYWPDGRVRKFAYQQNHLFSDCYINGSMTCVDCHDPHSQAYRDVFGKPLAGRFDNGQCNGCHASKERSPEQHSHHKPGSEGNLCTSCHMPFLQHQGLGDQLRFSRSDHVIPIPRPAFDESIGIENACKKCHAEKSIRLLQELTEKWYGKIKPHNPLTAKIMEAENITDIKTAADLLLHPKAKHPLAQFMGLVHFIKRFLKPDMDSLDSKILNKLKSLTQETDLDVKALALMAVHFSCGNNPQTRSFLKESLASLNKKENSVRSRWAIALDYIGSIYANKKNYKSAIKSYQKVLEINPTDAITLSNLGLAYRNLHLYQNAIMAYKKADQIKPNNVSILFSLGEVFMLAGQNQEAVTALNKGLQLDPKNQNAQRLLRQLTKL